MTARVGDVVVIAPEPDRECELCGKQAETRPYGTNGERICFECGKKNRAAVERHLKALFGESS